MHASGQWFFEFMLKYAAYMLHAMVIVLKYIYSIRETNGLHYGLLEFSIQSSEITYDIGCILLIRYVWTILPTW